MYSYIVTNPATTAVQFVVGNVFLAGTSVTGNVDLLARNGALPTPQQMTDGSLNPGNTPQQITIVTNALLPALNGTTWYLAVPNNTPQTVTFLITAVALTNAPPGYTFPAVAVTGMSLGAGGFTLQWAAVPGAQYQSQPDLRPRPSWQLRRRRHPRRLDRQLQRPNPRPPASRPLLPSPPHPVAPGIPALVLTFKGSSNYLSDFGRRRQRRPAGILNTFDQD